MHESVKLAYGYENWPIIALDEADKAPSLAPGKQTLSLCRTDARAPHVWIKPGVSTLDLFGTSFALLRF